MWSGAFSPRSVGVEKGQTRGYFVVAQQNNLTPGRGVVGLIAQLDTKQKLRGLKHHLEGRGQARERVGAVSGCEEAA